MSVRASPFVHDRDPSRRFFAFDMFGTLVVNIKGTLLPIFHALCGYYPDVKPSKLGYAYHTMTRKFKSTHRNRELPIDAIVRGLDETFGYEHDPSGMEDVLLRDVGLYGAADGAETTLSYLKSQGYRIGVYSNTRYHSPTLMGMLEDCGLLKYIDRVVTSADTGFRKPDPAAYEAITEALGTDLSRCFYCGDNPSKDYYGPLSVHMKGAVLIDPTMENPVRWKVRSIGEIPDLFENGDQILHSGDISVDDRKER